MKNIQRGLDKRQEQNPQQLVRDTRTFGQRLGDFFKKLQICCCHLSDAGSISIIFPGSS